MPRKKRERLVAIYHPKRGSTIFNYVLGFVVFILGVGGNVITAANLVEYNFISWVLGLFAMMFGLTLVLWTETRRRYILYIVTTWNIRIRTGYINKKINRVFYDEITKVVTASEPVEKAINQGNVVVYSVKSKDEPALIFTGVHNPHGIREVVLRFVATTPEPPPWSHVPRD
jgi:membrane protein YdbS with pleckstrin-like domain